MSIIVCLGMFILPVRSSIDGCAKMSKIADTAVSVKFFFSAFALPLCNCLCLALRINRTW